MKIDIKKESTKTVKERIELLEGARKILKSEFVGLDNIIDQFLQAITPWYLTPEVINRPVVVSLWGMTGTGKSSLVNRAVKLLDIDKKTINFDCGKIADSGTDSISEIITTTLCLDSDDCIDFTAEDVRDCVFILDEFQFAKTLDESGKELGSNDTRSIWNMIDTGSLDFRTYYSRIIYSFLSIQNILTKYLITTENDFKILPGLRITDEKLRKDIENLPGNDGYLESVSTKNILNKKIEFFSIIDEDDFDGSDEDQSTNELETRNDDNGKDEYCLFLLKRKIIQSLVGKCNAVKAGSGDLIYGKLKSVRKLSELLIVMSEIKQLVMTPKKIECDKSLIITIGNLDEVFDIAYDLNADNDADVLYDITSKITIYDIKDALLRRFRPEQVARLGSNLIKYPTLNRKHFLEIVTKEVNRVISEYEKSTGIHIKVDSRVVDLIYEEGVCPSQGTRPIFTTVGTLMSPILSKILMHQQLERDNIKNAEVKLKEEVERFNIPEVIIEIILDNKEVLEHVIKLQLGELRCPEKCLTRYINAVHEAGHAIVLSYLTGQIPSKIVSVSSSGGGFCVSYIPENEKKIWTKRDLDNEILTLLGGYTAEKLVYSNTDDLTLLGSGSDLERAKDLLIDSWYKLGYSNPKVYALRDIEKSVMGLPNGLDQKGDDIEKYMQIYYNNLMDRCKEILQREQKLLAQTAIYLGNYGSMTALEFENMISKYGVELNKDHIDSIKNKKEQYLDRLIQLSNL